MPQTTTATRQPVEVRPRTTPEPALLIGTVETLASLRRVLETAPGRVEPRGCLVVEGDRSAGAESAGATAAPGIGGLASIGSIDELPRVRDDLGVRVAIVSLPSSMWSSIRRVRAELARAGLSERFVPPLAELLHQPPAVPSVGPGTAPVLDLASLIGREPHAIDHERVRALLDGRRVLITGAGGSIGSELARIVASYGPSLVALMDRSENALFEIDRRLRERFGSVPRRAVLHDVVDGPGTRELVAEVRPHIVFHAAAHKHVPLMEDHPAHAVTNNLFGTRSIAEAAAEAGVERFVMVSTDKAVNPTSVMGATKRLAEFYVADLHERVRRNASPGTTPTGFSMVRFGNVLGSACSVLTIWGAQLAEGGPLTITDPRMTRFFMTIPEAASLVVQAAAMSDPASGGPAGVFVLDMGQPVRILDLAERFVRAHGVEPVHQDDASPARPTLEGAPTIDLVCTGIRPGEKLHEELAYATEELAPTAHPGIRMWLSGTTPEIDVPEAMERLETLRAGSDRDAIAAALRRYIPTLAPPTEARRIAV